jgi:hypothetical protein
MPNYRKKLSEPPIQYDLIGYVSERSRETIRAYNNGRLADKVDIKQIQKDLTIAIDKVRDQTLKRLKAPKK